MIFQRPGSQSDRTSTWSRARRDLATPQGSSLISAFLLCAFISLTLDIIGGYVLHLSGSIVYPVIMVIDIFIIVAAVIKVSAMYRKSAEVNRELYRQRFESDMEAIRIWSERKRSRNLLKEKEKHGLTYEDAGVSIDTKEEAFRAIKEIIRSTYRPEVLSDMGHFGGLFALDKAKYEDPVLVSSNDSVGTKLKIAFMMNKHNTVGFDIVAHCANDILVLGAEPLFFLDYIGISKVDPQVMVQLIEGLAAGCKEVGCALIGGETAELPSLYHAGEYDLAGTIVGIIERHKVITGDRIKPGDKMIGLASDGLHTNGFSLARKILFEVCELKVDDLIQKLGITVGAELLKPHRSYVKPVLELIKEFNTDDFKIKGLAHITGGGLLDNIPRILPEKCSAEIEKGTWNIPPVFTFLQEKGNVAEREMYRVFNMGIGMVVVASADYARQMADRLKSFGETVYNIGTIIEGNKTVIIK